MEYPHRRYILYLLSRRMAAFEIRADCQSKGLVPPEDGAISSLNAELGPVPTYWRAAVTRRNVKLRRWLRDRGLLDLWVRDEHSEAAFNFLFRKNVRKDFETVLLAHGNTVKARKELLVKYPEGLVPEEVVLDRYRTFFWDTGSMTPEGIFSYLEACEGRDTYLPALQGDLVSTYGVLGLQQKIKAETFLQNIVEAANQQALLLRANPFMSGANKAGTSAVLKVGMDAMVALGDLHTEGEGDLVIRKDAADFVARVVQAPQIPSIDEISRGDVIDEAEIAGEANVHQLIVR